VITVIPSILAKTPEEFTAMVRKLEPHTKRVHLDIIDGEFAPTTTIKGYKELLECKTDLLFDVHLMVKKPAEQLKHWFETRADRIILHAEAEGDMLTMLEELEQNGKRRALALNPETPFQNVGSFLPHLDFMQFMTVNPGFYGSPFVPEVIGKIEQFRGMYPHMAIAVDGGITPETAPQVCTAGASILVVGSYIMNSQDISKTIKNLQTQ